MSADSFIFLAVLCIHLAGCLYLPVSKSEPTLNEYWSEVQLRPLVGQSIDSVATGVFSSPTWKVFDGGQTHLIYGHQADYGVLILMGGGGGFGEYVGTRTRCFRLSFDEDGVLYAFDGETDTDAFDLWPSEINDCRLKFWTEDELASIRQELEARAKSGDHKAEAVLLEFSSGDDLVRQSEVDLKSAYVAAWEDSSIAMRKRTQQTRKAAKEDIEAHRDDLLPRAEAGDAEAQYALGSSYYRDREERWYWICRAAHGGHSEAMMMKGASLIAKAREEDIDAALLWFLLAERTGSVHGAKAAQQLSEHMKQEKILIVENRLDAWKPNPESCGKMDDVRR
ncbi:MAG: hypothetical protein V2J55_20820 [Candidatus Competibacteraceae bacterium]|jgi:hypothetical protein|nr:hypothetical protein [Candidatus Competibacteraceae bacterium]